MRNPRMTSQPSVNSSSRGGRLGAQSGRLRFPAGFHPSRCGKDRFPILSASTVRRYTDATWARLRRLSPAHLLLGQLMLLVVIDFAIHWTLVTQFHGDPAWGNFIEPFTTSQYPNGPALFWNPFQYGGYPTGLAFATISSYVVALGPLTAFSVLFGATAGAKLYILLSTLFLGATSLLFARTVVRHPIGQLATAVLVMAGPFQVALYGQADYIGYVVEGLIFLSLFAFWLAVNRPTQRWVWFPLSFWLILFTYSIPQGFLLGMLLMGCLIPVYVRD